MTKFAPIFIACFVISPVAFGKSTGDAAAGKNLAETWQCTLCHGPDGNGNKASVHFVSSNARRTPRISAQPQAYFIKSMQEYKTGKRDNEDMQTMAQQLSDRDIRDLAAWYGSQTPRAYATYYNDPSR